MELVIMKPKKIMFKCYNDPQEYENKGSGESIYCVNMSVLNTLLVTYNLPWL